MPIPGYVGDVKSEKHMLEIANEIGYPVMIKAAHGGGGKGTKNAFHIENIMVTPCPIVYLSFHCNFCDQPQQMLRICVLDVSFVFVCLIYSLRGNRNYRYACRVQ
jgi:hypothetical protein